jgi:CheY-like chemotaxis protein
MRAKCFPARRASSARGIRQLYEIGDGRIRVDEPPLNAVLHDQLPDDNAGKPALSGTPEEQLRTSRRLAPQSLYKIEQFFDSLRGTLALVPIFIVLVRRTMPCEKARLLIVDDKQLVRTSISHLFAEIGYSVRSAQDGFSALRELREEIPDILLSDLNMPGMSGYELLRVVRRRFPSIQVIAMSGAFSGDEVPSGVAADAFYQKGSSMGALLRIIESLRLMERRDPLPVRIVAPLLIQRNESDTFREAHVMIACSECLRTFPQPIYGSGSRERTTNCIYCGSSIRYSVVEPLNQMPLRSFYRRAGAEISAHGASDAGD